jgi:hypothetical protein
MSPAVHQFTAITRMEKSVPGLYRQRFAAFWHRGAVLQLSYDEKISISNFRR